MSNEINQAETAVEKIKDVALPMIVQANEISSTLKFPNKESYANADSCYNELHRIWKTGEDHRLSFTAPLNEVLKKINSIFKTKLDPIDEAKKKLKRSMDNYATEEMMWKRREDARIAAEKKKAEEEALALAIKLENEGKQKESEVALKEAVVIEKKEAETTVGATDVSKSFTKTTWMANIIDMSKFLHAIADNPNYVHFYSIERGELNRYAKLTKGTVNIPGVEFKEVAEIGAKR